MSERTLFLTGADGYLGRAIARDWLAHEEGKLVLWVRAATAGEFERKLRGLREEFPASHCRFAWGDLRLDEPFAGIDAWQITHIVHAAALTRFNVGRSAAEAVNVQGTLRVLELAERAPKLAALDILSTVYSAGLRSGPLPECALEGRRSFANEYERSKARMETLVAAREDLPWRLHRISTVIADDRDGAVTQMGAFHQTMRLLYGGWLPLLPGRANTPVHVCDLQSVVRALRGLREAPLRRFYQHNAVAPVQLSRLIDVAFEEFTASEAFAQRRLLRPPLCDRESFELLCDGVGATREPLLRGALDSVAVFAPQLYARHELRQEKTLEALGDPRFFGDSEALLRATLGHLVRERWQRTVRHVA